MAKKKKKTLRRVKKSKASKRSVSKKRPKRRAAPRAQKIKRMDRKSLKKYKLMLLKEREKAGEDLTNITRNTLNKSAKDASGDLSGYSYHMADMASDDYERDFSLGRATDEQKRLYTIDEAIKRVEDGTYGNCLQCGKTIAKSRLRAMPYAELCIDCQKTNESR